MSEFKIQCPKCKWKPDGRAHWMCTCGYCWNTFDTQGTCPACKKRWVDTQCPIAAGGCDQWSRHVDWYIIPIDLEELMEETVKVEVERTPERKRG